MMMVLAIAKKYNQLPSDVIGLTEPIERYFFDSACAYYDQKLEEGKKPRLESERKVNPGLQQLLK